VSRQALLSRRQSGDCGSSKGDTRLRVPFLRKAWHVQRELGDKTAIGVNSSQTGGVAVSKAIYSSGASLLLGKPGTGEGEGQQGSNCFLKLLSLGIVAHVQGTSSARVHL
jgi:hypothetical protein